MRKMIALWAAVFLLFALPAAGEELPYDPDTLLSVLPLTQSQQDLADFLYGPVFRGESPIALPPGTRYADVAPALNALTQDHPELFHLGTEYRISYYTSAPEIATQVELTYRVSPEEAASLRAQLYIRAGLMVAENPDPLALHDALCAAVTYGGDGELRHTAVGALLQGEATCEGYAQALTLLCRMAGVPCGVIVGDATDDAGATQRHAWNIADIGGFTLIDPTWNDQSHLGVNTHWYYGLSTVQMAADHTPDGEQAVPLCGDQANWHTRQGLVIATEEQLDAALRVFSREGEINLRFTDGALYIRAAHDAYALLDDFSRRCPEDAFYGGYSLMYSDAQMCVILQRTE